MGSVSPGRRRGADSRELGGFKLALDVDAGATLLRGRARIAPSSSAWAPSGRACPPTRRCDATARIPLRPGGPDSLNVAVAAAVAL